MNITLVKDTVLPVSKYGGTERVMWALGHELSKMGHHVTFLIRKGASCPFARIIEMDPSFSVASQIPQDTDVVHFQDGADLRELDKAFLVTVNGNGYKEEDLPPNAVFVSRNHAERYHRTSFVYNGLDWDEYGTVDLSRPRQSFHFLGKAAWHVKNVKGAIRITEGIKGATLEVLGGYRLNFKMGFRFTLNPKIKFRGMVDNEEKKKYIETSRGLIFPIKWHEPFGLCIIESLYYGAPVFGTRMGSLPELVKQEVGWLGENEQQLIDYLNTDWAYSPKTCHEYATDLFNARVMAEAYLKMYENVMNGKTLR